MWFFNMLQYCIVVRFCLEVHMKIQDKLKAVDYYDFAYAPYLDRNLVYDREEIFIAGSRYWTTFDKNLPLHADSHDHPLYNLENILNSIIEFYGLHLVNVLLNGKFYSYFKNTKTNDVPVSINDVMEKIKNNQNDILLKRGGKGSSFRKCNYVKVINHLGNIGGMPLDKSLRLFDYYQQILSGNYTILNQTYNAPIITISNYNGVMANSNLKNCGFHHILPAEQTIQEIALFLGNAKNNVVVLEPNDEIKIAKHGFDKKSFKD